MANMSYVMFENTCSDFRECLYELEMVDNFDEMELSPSEKGYSANLYNLAKRYVEEFERLTEYEDE